MIKTGIDLVYIPEFESSQRAGGENFVKKVFHSCELQKVSGEHLAGIFAAKEAIAKALSLPAGSWLKIYINNDEDGRPQVKLPKFLEEKITSYDLSISHSRDYAVAVFVVLA